MATPDDIHSRSRAGSRPASAIDVPLRRTDLEAFSFYENVHDFVGSPEQIGRDAAQTPQTRTRLLPAFDHASSTSSKPVLENHRVSSPRHVSRQRAGTITSRAEHTNLSRHTPGSQTPRLHSWSLFSQLMENEGQLRASGSEKSSGYVTPSHTSHTSVTDPFLDPPHEGHSPYHNGHTDYSSEHYRERVASPENVAIDYDSDNSDSVTLDNRAPSPSIQKRRWFSLKRLPPVPTLYRNVLKCGIAYFIASLFTFSPYLSGFISDITSYGPGAGRPSPSGHMVATIAVYFNPAKTMGGMVEADIFCMVGLLYAAFVCLSSMSMFWWLDVKPGWEWLADVLVILWIGLSMSGVAWMKVWMAKPSFNTACSMTAIILFVVIVKEGGAETLLQVSLIVLVGSVVSNAVCYIVWPQRATYNLQENMTKTLDSFSTLLRMLTNTFLLEEPLHQPCYQKLTTAVENHQASFTSLKKNLLEAHSEWFYGGPTTRDGSAKAYEDAVDSLNRLAQHLNGLRSGTRLQYELTKAHSDGKVVLKHRTTPGKFQHNGGTHKIIDVECKGKGRSSEGNYETEEEETALLQEAAAMFGDLVDDLGPPLKALSSTCTSSLKRLREAFVRRHRTSHQGIIQPQQFHELTDGIERALFNFESTSNHALLRLYRRNILSVAPSRSSVYSAGEDVVLAGSDNEHVFLVYFFIFTLQEFSHELVSLVDAMSRIYAIEQERANHSGRWDRIFSGFSCMWTRVKTQTTNQPKPPGLRRSLSFIIPQNRHIPTFFPKIRPHAPNTIQTPPRSKLTFIGRIKQSLWTIGARLKERDLKYAIKAGMATGVLAAPAFFDATRPVFTEYRGEWALISFFVVISPTIGATNFMSVHRVVGTLLGGGVAAGIYSAFPDNAVVLSIFGFFFSLPCFWYIVAKPEYATSGRFVLLTYNLTCLFCYNLRQIDVSPLHVAGHRIVAVTVGVVWAALVSRFWWPAEARRELSKALGEFCLNVGWLYTRLVASNSFGPEAQELHEMIDDDSREGASLLPKPATTRLNNSIQEFMAMELHLQIKLIELQGLLAQAQHEPRLKGPFPVELYRSILTSLQTILDRLHSMRCVTTREEWFTASIATMFLPENTHLIYDQAVREDFIVPVNKERREMVGNIILSFSTLASAFRLKAPLPPYLPPAEKARQRLVEAIRRLDVVRNRDAKGSRQLLFFAYALTMKGVTQELDYLGRTLQEAFGVIGQTREEFEALFIAQEGRTERLV